MIALCQAVLACRVCSIKTQANGWLNRPQGAGDMFSTFIVDEDRRFSSQQSRYCPHININNLNEMNAQHAVHIQN